MERKLRHQLAKAIRSHWLHYYKEIHPDPITHGVWTRFSDARIITIAAQAYLDTLSTSTETEHHETH